MNKFSPNKKGAANFSQRLRRPTFNDKNEQDLDYRKNFFDLKFANHNAKMMCQFVEMN